MTKDWYYRTGDTQFGPVAKEELTLMLGQGKISLDDYVWKQGYETWIKARDAKDLFGNVAPPPPFIPEVKVPSIPEGRRTGLKVASVLMIVSAAIWAMITISQILYLAFEGANGILAFDAAWNLVWTVASLAIGIGIWKQRHWAYKWGITSSVIGVLWYGTAFFNGVSAMLFFAIIEVAIGVVLFANREYFNEKAVVTS
ncbi:DUF4339 domain-containing protein [Brevibacillus agri]|uniref:DUF4339 domain-containing protein n=1 Tax=Brevibacillus agri TaxID=51101 RepID=UPI003D1DD35D